MLRASCRPGNFLKRRLRQCAKQNTPDRVAAIRGENANRGQFDRGDDLHCFQIVSGRLPGLAVHHDLEGNTLALTQFAQAGALDGADMDKHVFATAFGLNESITLLRVKPLYGAVIHESLLIDMQM